MNTLIGIAGSTASGKTSVAANLEEKYGAWRMRYSAILADLADERGIPHDKASLQHLSTELRATHSEDFLTRLMRERVACSNADIIVIEGNRRMVDIKLLETLAKETGRTLTLLYIDADTESRFMRINGRLESEGKPPLTRDAFDTLENDECEEELPLVRTYIETHGTLLDTTSLSLEQVLEMVEKHITLTT